MEYDLTKIADIIKTSKVIAIVGLSPKPERPSNQVAVYMMNQGYEIIPVNPGHDKILSRLCYPSLPDIPDQVHIVDVFRRPEDVLPLMNAAIQIKAPVVWLQEGVRNEEASKLATDHGILFFQDICIKKMHQKCQTEGLL